MSPEMLLERNRAQTVSETDDFTVERYKQMHRHFPVLARTVLDAGCNTGRGGKALKDLDVSLQVIGLDCVAERLAKLDPAVYSKSICGFSTQIPAESGSVDCIVAGEFLEHINPIEVDATLAEFFRILKLRGRLLLTTPNPGYLKNKMRRLSVLLEASHLTQHYPDCLKQRLRLIGFSGVKIYGSGRMIKYIGEKAPFLPVYGSYLVTADKW